MPETGTTAISGVFLLGLLLGMRHALEADHVAAVATITSRAGSLREGIRHGVAWGMGHTATLLLFGGIILFATGAVPERISNWLEFIVGLMLVFLGTDLLRRWRREGLHVHVHEHGDGRRHVHVHAHPDSDTDHAHPAAHAHEHPTGLPWRAFLVGLVHGMAGTAALVLLTLQTLQSPWLGILYIFVFGIGSIIGMGLFSWALSIPLLATRHLGGLTRALQLVIGLGTITLGLWTLHQHWPLA